MLILIREAPPKGAVIAELRLDAQKCGIAEPRIFWGSNVNNGLDAVIWTYKVDGPTNWKEYVNDAWLA